MNNFKYLNPKDLKEASSQLGADWKTSLPFAGGTDILGLMKDSIESPKQLVNLKSLSKMDQIEYRSGKGLTIGAMATISEISENSDIISKYPILAQAAKEVASPQLRNIGTIGGNICQRPRCWYFRGEFDCLRKGGDICYAVDGKNKFHCIVGGGPCFIVHPSDIAVALLALKAKLTIFSNGKTKQVSVDKFFVLPEEDVTRENSLKPDEIVVDVQIPDLKSNVVSTYHKMKERGAWDFAVVSVGVVAEKSGDTIKNGRITLGGVAPVPWLEKKASDNLKNFKVTEDNLSELTNSVLVDAEPLEMNEFKLYLAKNMIKKVLRELAA
jgi:xanthine dehydrogenase YagS FAD-binding subunit